jgi:DNA-binding NarL/FixJ family response regulator
MAIDTGASGHTRVLLVEDDAMVRGWVELALRGSEFAIAGVAGSAAEAVEESQRIQPDLLLVDYRLPDRTGAELLKELRRRGERAPAILMTANAEGDFNELAQEAGAQGTALKTGKASELLSVLRAAPRRQRTFDERYPRRGLAGVALSPREREVLRLVATGATNAEIAESLSIARDTVKTLLARTFEKLGVHRRAEAVAAAYKLGLL